MLRLILASYKPIHPIAMESGLVPVMRWRRLLKLEPSRLTNTVFRERIIRVS
jgi:hypothetical protein